MKKIKLTQGKYAIVDDEDFEWLSQWNWQYMKLRGYASKLTSRKLGHGRINMHTLIMSPPPGLVVDHINRNGLDNRRKNLRIATTSQNAFNRKLNENNTSGFKGVYFCKENARKKWIATICINQKSTYLGGFKNKEDAIKARKKAMIKYHGDFVRYD